MSLLPILPSPSSSSSIRRTVGFLRASQRAVADAARLLLGLVLLRPLVLLHAELGRRRRQARFLVRVPPLLGVGAAATAVAPRAAGSARREGAAAAFLFLLLSKERRPPLTNDDQRRCWIAAWFDLVRIPPLRGVGSAGFGR